MYKVRVAKAGTVHKTPLCDPRDYRRMLSQPHIIAKVVLDQNFYGMKNFKIRNGYKMEYTPADLESRLFE